MKQQETTRPYLLATVDSTLRAAATGSRGGGLADNGKHPPQSAADGEGAVGYRSSAAAGAAGGVVNGRQEANSAHTGTLQQAALCRLQPPAPPIVGAKLWTAARDESRCGAHGNPRHHKTLATIRPPVALGSSAVCRQVYRGDQPRTPRGRADGVKPPLGVVKGAVSQQDLKRQRCYQRRAAGAEKSVFLDRKAEYAKNMVLMGIGTGVAPGGRDNQQQRKQLTFTHPRQQQHAYSHLQELELLKRHTRQSLSKLTSTTITHLPTTSLHGSAIVNVRRVDPIIIDLSDDQSEKEIGKAEKFCTSVEKWHHISSLREPANTRHSTSTHGTSKAFISTHGKSAGSKSTASTSTKSKSTHGASTSSHETPTASRSNHETSAVSALGKFHSHDPSASTSTQTLAVSRASSHDDVLLWKLKAPGKQKQLNDARAEFSKCRSTWSHTSALYNTRDEAYTEQRQGDLHDLLSNFRKQLTVHGVAPDGKVLRRTVSGRVVLPYIAEEPEDVLLEDEPEDLIELTAEQLAVVEQASYPKPEEEVLVEAFKIPITRKDIQTLTDLHWLNDQVITFYLSLVCERSVLAPSGSAYRSCYTFNTYFYPKLADTESRSLGGYQAVRRWTRQVDVFSYDILLVPVHLSIHWCMAIILLKEKKIEYYDSMGGKNIQCLQVLSEYLKSEHQDKKKAPYDLSDWKLVIREDIPHQKNGADCGMFACKFAEYASRGADVTFTQEDIPYFRERMIYEIVNRRLL